MNEVKRYIVNQPLDQLPVQQYDVVIAGAGLSGIYAALSLDDDLQCAILLKNRTHAGNSWLAQGGIAAVVNPDDHYYYHYFDTLKASAGMAEEKAISSMVMDGPDGIKRLARLGVKFDTDSTGRWHTTLEGAHTHKRILHCGGDATGRIIMEALLAQVRQRKNIQILEDHFLTDIITGVANEVCGAVVWHEGFRLLKAPAVIICTGGAGAIYKYSTNCRSTTGDGIAAAIRAGAEMMNMEFVQFHPTALFESGKEESFLLISEAVRGEGGIIRNMDGAAVMNGRHHLKDLAPRDFVAREMFFEMQRTGDEHLWIDITSRPASFLRKRFPTVYNLCAERGIRMEKDMIPVIPVQHYFMGGIRTGLHGETNIMGLFACGEAACTGVHGANRLASNSLLECIVFAGRAARVVNSRLVSGKMQEIKITDGLPVLSPESETLPADEFLTEIREIMHHAGGIVRNGIDMQNALNRINQILLLAGQNAPSDKNYFETYNAALVAAKILEAALARPDGIGSHFRSDSVLVNY
jgi:L-aspartate oxidase